MCFRGLSFLLLTLVLAMDQVFDISSLQIFAPYELDHLLCGRRELWEVIGFFFFFFFPKSFFISTILILIILMQLYADGDSC